jgi:hypothetical protein
MKRYVNNQFKHVEGSGLDNLDYPGICLEGFSKSKKHVSHDSRSPGRDLNPRDPEYEAEC